MKDIHSYEEKVEHYKSHTTDHPKLFFEMVVVSYARKILLSDTFATFLPILWYVAQACTRDKET